jgi:hypothetical protein
MLIHIQTEAILRPTGPLTPLEIYELTKQYAGLATDIEIEPTATVQQLADAADTSLNIDTSKTNEELLYYNDVLLDNTTTLESNGITDGATIQYKFVLIV